MQINKAFEVVYWWTKINKTNAKNSDFKKARMTLFRMLLLNAMGIITNNQLIIKSLIRRTGSLLQSKSMQI